MIESSTFVNIDQLEPGEPLSPELVLVLPPELRADALARLGPPQWAKPRPPLRAATPPAENSLTQTLRAVLLPRAAHLMLTFVVVTVLTLTLSAVANAIRGARAPHFSSLRPARLGGPVPVNTLDSRLLSVLARAGECQATARVGHEGRPVAEPSGGWRGCPSRSQHPGRVGEGFPRGGAWCAPRRARAEAVAC